MIQCREHEREGKRSGKARVGQSAANGETGGVVMPSGTSAGKGGSTRAVMALRAVVSAEGGNTERERE